MSAIYVFLEYGKSVTKKKKNYPEFLTDFDVDAPMLDVRNINKNIFKKNGIHGICKTREKFDRRCTAVEIIQI